MEILKTSNVIGTESGAIKLLLEETRLLKIGDIS